MGLDTKLFLQRGVFNIIERFGAHCLFLFVASTHISVAIYANYRMGIKESTIAEEKRLSMMRL